MNTVFVTGAGGSIGSELSIRLAYESDARLVLIDSCEFNLYSVQQRMEGAGFVDRVEYLYGDIRHAHLMNELFRHYRPDEVYHAAALKHVPMMENPHNAMEGLRTNVLGTENVAACAQRWGAQKFVLISTDKAVQPCSMMGATKAMAEQVVRLFEDLKVVVVRFGNVIGSSGSAIPLWQKQIAAGGPVTVTHPKMVRFFMTIADAVGLVVEGSKLKEGYQCKLVLDMGPPRRIVDVVTSLMQGREIPIQWIGIRPGEKLEELLVDPETERLVKTTHPMIRRVQNLSALDLSVVEKALEDLKTAVEQRDFERCQQSLKTVVPYEGGIECSSL